MKTGIRRGRGRPRKPYVTSWGEHINGLRRRESDGRWVIVATGDMFSESDERLAVARFHRTSSNGRIVLSASLAELGHKVNPKPEGQFRDDTARAAWAALQTVQHIPDVSVAFNPDTPPGEWDMQLRSHEPLVWAWVAQQIRLRPEYVAKQTGIEQIGYLVDLKKPERPASFKEIEDAWEAYFTKSAEQKRRVLYHWREFVRVMKVVILKDITDELAVQFRDIVYARKLSPKMEENIFTRIRRILTFASKERLMKGVEPAVHALRHLRPSDETTALDPKPIEVADWRKLLAQAEGVDRAMILLMLNGAFYLEEVRRLTWDTIRNGAIVTHRKKEGRCVRACVLWPETVAALNEVKRRGEHIFYNYAGQPLGIKGAELRFRRLRDAAGVPHVSASHLRDGAATAMAESNVSEKVSNILMGHRNPGVSDHYVKRNPRMVAPACMAIYSAYVAENPISQAEAEITSGRRAAEA